MVSSHEGEGQKPTDSLEGVVTHLTRRAQPGGSSRGSTRRSPDTDPTVRWFLDAGVELLTETYSYFKHREDDTAYASANDFLRAIPDAKVMDRFELIADANGVAVGKNNKSRRKTLWAYANEYHQDLIAFIFRPYFHDSRMVDIRDFLRQAGSLPLAQLVEALAVSETDEVTQAPEVQLQLALQASFPSDPRIRKYAQDLYEHQGRAWASIYEDIAAVYGIGIASGLALDWDDMSTIFNIVVEGAGIRRKVQPSLGELSNGEHVSVRMIQMLLTTMTATAWSNLAELTGDLTQLP
jgi:hypothetical protein